ncbi:unnamed protein product [Penicillium olsonii]|uniref:Uncharacterized protein n=1 Tax=Penicillium olsonii TaxID=99116 RepID=A0A9W4MMK3_PENOL|nr:unnamed protein product [Penicillium olsonii]CAG7977637.1 unnamed protein product [Penicillium olsonii]
MIPEVKNAMGNKLILIIGDLANLRAKLHTNVLTDSQQILSESRSIEADLIAWLAAVPPDFIFSSHSITPEDQSFERRCHGITAYNNEYHIYSDIWAPNCWNHYRCARIFVSELILSQVNKMPQTSPTIMSEDIRFYCKSLRSTISHLAADICRSVPFHLGACNAEVPPGTPAIPPESYLGGLMLLWPLFVAGIVEGPNHPQRRWVIHCLQIIGNTWGLAQALATMDILNVDPGMFHCVGRSCQTTGSGIKSPKLFPVSVYQMSYHRLPEMKQYRELQASSA